MKKIGKLWFFFLGILLLTGCSEASINTLSIEELEEKIANKETFIVEVVQTGCSACASFAPTFEGVMAKYKLKAYRINTTNLSEEDSKKLDAISYISGTPTTLFFVKGELGDSSHKLVGSVSSDTLKTRLKYLDFIEEE